MKAIVNRTYPKTCRRKSPDAWTCGLAIGIAANRIEWIVQTFRRMKSQKQR